MEKVAVLDSGGQYCHLIARKVRELGVYAEILPVGAATAELVGYRGIILSGGPDSVFAPHSPRPDPHLFELGTPTLGICYGLQLLAHLLGGSVERGRTHEFGIATLRVRRPWGLFDGLADEHQVWMSHGDHVVRPPAGFDILADTSECGVAAIGDARRKLFGLQFHPEVAHTPTGADMLRNFLRGVCGCSLDWRTRDCAPAGGKLQAELHDSATVGDELQADPLGRVTALARRIRQQAGSRRVLFFLSGGVDSTVAHALTVRALGRDRVKAWYVDTGFMRHGETAEIEEALQALELGSLNIRRAGELFMDRLRGVVDPERKRSLIGQAFVDVQDEILGGADYAGRDWMLGQGTIYPDTIESGGTQSAAVIKTHHNRVDRIQELIEAGRVLEPLSELYKDEVRALGRALGLPPSLLERHPFPGPGLAIRCLCAAGGGPATLCASIRALANEVGYEALLLPLRSVGVQGDSRSYAQLTVLHGGALDYQRLLPLSTAITNAHRHTNRIAALLSPASSDVSEWAIRPATLTPGRIALLQRADRTVTDFLRSEELYDQVWQCPVVLLPWSRAGGETVALRPITSVDGMTAAVARLPPDRVAALAASLRAIQGVDAVLYDVSNKPPATIEWE